jgi:hypothetical protein
MRLLLLLLCAAGARGLVTVPINKDGETYALLDFHQHDAEYVISTARQFCIDHGFSDAALRSIVEHTLAEINKIEQATPKSTPALAAETPAAKLPESASQLLAFMKSKAMSAPDVLKAVAQLIEGGHTN